jgi:hypothetical protein
LPALSSICHLLPAPASTCHHLPPYLFKTIFITFRSSLFTLRFTTKITQHQLISAWTCSAAWNGGMISGMISDMERM